MIESNLEYELRFTGLGELQEEKQYHYQLCGKQGDATGFCIRISAWKNGGKYTESEKIFTANGQQAQNVLQLLYENRVAPVHLGDVMSDLKFMGAIAMHG